MTRLGQATLLGFLWGILGPALPAQEGPLQLSFSVGNTASYRIQLTVRSEVIGQQTETIGAKTYVRPFAQSAQRGLNWTATRRVLSVGPDGIAEIEETLDHFEGAAEARAAADEKAARLDTALREALGSWGATPKLHYRETHEGQVLDLKADGVPSLGEAPPALLTLWLVRALRPAAALPSAPIRLGERWQEPRSTQLPNWSEVRGSETGEWLDSPGAAQPALRLHVVQQISGTVVSGAERPPEGMAQGTFHGESLNTVALGDGQLLGATRSATREITWILVPVEGLSERPQFTGRLAVQIEIEACNEDPCLPPQPPVGGNQQ
jgi:hypothetical protein